MNQLVWSGMEIKSQWQSEKLVSNLVTWYRIWKGILRIQDLTKKLCGIRDLTAPGKLRICQN